MKSEIIKNEKELEFPCLMISEDTGNVYLMSSEKVGTCVHSVEKSTWKIGEQSNSLGPSVLIPFEGKVILQND